MCAPVIFSPGQSSGTPGGYGVTGRAQTRPSSSSRKQIMPATAELGMGFFPSTPVQVEVGGATVFVLNVERFEKL